MTEQTRERGIALFILLLAPLTLFLMDNAEAACSGTDTYTVHIYDPSGTEVASSSADISPVGGTDCNSGTSDEANAYAYCQEPGIYTANISCDSCSSHSSVLEQNVLTCYGPEQKRFVIRNDTGADIAAFDSKGYIYLRGTNHSNQGTLNPPPKSYIIRAPGGTDVAYIDSSGNFYFKGSLSTEQTTINPPDNSLIFRNHTQNDVAYIDSSGNVVLSGKLYFDWNGDI